MERVVAESAVAGGPWRVGALAERLTAPPADPAVDAPAPDVAPAFSEDGPTARINVRLPERLKAAVEEAAAGEGRSVNAWLVRAAADALRLADRHARAAEPRARRGGSRFSGWVR
ncbi:YlcI/YnfO family protein [Actinosynnema pretiosum]|uniref:YlcI/YnfO family protein n=1 Tax=Actinosynnema pretiosum TaxID=42197 RepID=UPI0026BE8080